MHMYEQLKEKVLAGKAKEDLAQQVDFGFYPEAEKKPSKRWSRFTRKKESRNNDRGRKEEQGDEKSLVESVSSGYSYQGTNGYGKMAVEGKRA